MMEIIQSVKYIKYYDMNVNSSNICFLYYITVNKILYMIIYTIDSI
jgi:hypothetical protein